MSEFLKKVYGNCYSVLLTAVVVGAAGGMIAGAVIAGGTALAFNCMVCPETWLP